MLALHHGERRPLDEVSRLLDLPVSTVKWRVFRARKALARALERER
jgi:DNA-directed RNA polymerase specialized sigma24 family protein